MTGEADLVADLRGILFDPRIGRIGQDLASEECHHVRGRYLYSEGVMRSAAPACRMSV